MTLLSQNVTRGLVLAASAYLIFTLQDVAVRWLVANAGFTVWQVLLSRSVSIVTIALYASGPKLFSQALQSRHKKSLLLRGCFILGAWLCYYNAAKHLLYGQLVTIYYAAPIIITVLSIPLLKERVGPSRWIAVFVGFAGVVIACDPGDLRIELPVWMTLGAAFMWGMSSILLRMTSATESTLLQMFMSNSIFALGCIGPAIWYWQQPTPFEWLLLLSIGCLGGTAQYLLFDSFKHAPASAIAPMEYSALVWAFGAGFVVWGEVPGKGVFLGAAIIAASGLGSFIAERRQQRKTISA
jgi:drug/metabolite transporter (DMT)-like permease